MPKELTPEQARQVKEHHRKTVMSKRQRKVIPCKPITMEEAAKLLPGMVIQHKISFDDKRRK